MFNIAIADDHLLFSLGLKELLVTEIEFNVVGIAKNGADLITIIDHNHVDLAIIDIRMPVLDGVSTCKKLRVKYPNLKIIVLSMFAEISIATELKKIGAHGYIFKDSDNIEIINHVYCVRDGKTAFPEISEISETNFYYAAFKNDFQNTLTRREIEITSLIRMGLTSNKIALKLFISLNTVKQHRKHILKKLRLNNIQELVAYAISHNIK
jgi:DNA-binding NarL/FixJ family response regulator